MWWAGSAGTQSLINKHLHQQKPAHPRLLSTVGHLRHSTITKACTIHIENPRCLHTTWPNHWPKNLQSKSTFLYSGNKKLLQWCPGILLKCKIQLVFPYSCLTRFVISLYEGNELFTPVLMPPVWPPELNSVDLGLCKEHVLRAWTIHTLVISYAKNPDNLACCFSSRVGSSLLMFAMPDSCTYRRAMNRNTNTTIRMMIAPTTHPRMMPTTSEHTQYHHLDSTHSYQLSPLCYHQNFHL